MKLVYALILLGIFIYTLGFAITLWKEKQKFGSIAVVFLCIVIAVLPFLTIFK